MGYELINQPGPQFNIKMTSYQYRKSHCGDKTILRPSYLHNGISYTGKMRSLYWIGAQQVNPGQVNSTQAFSNWWCDNHNYHVGILLNCNSHPSMSNHYSGIIMGVMTTQITSLTIVYSTVYSGTDQRKHQSPASLAFVRGIHRCPVNSPHKRTSNAENVSTWWRHHVYNISRTKYVCVLLCFVLLWLYHCSGVINPCSSGLLQRHYKTTTHNNMWTIYF